MKRFHQKKRKRCAFHRVTNYMIQEGCMNVVFTKSALFATTALSLIAAAPAFAQSAPQAPAPAPAQETASAAGEGAADIIVNARRVEERLQDVPISITVFNQQQLTNRNVVNAADLANYTPSLSANANFGSENTSFAIRGFTQDAGTPPSVGVYFADVVAPRGPTQGTQAGDGAGPGNFFDLQNVQVLKGPQGTLQGRNTTGGAVLFVPQRPTYKFEGYIEGSYGNYDMKRVQGAINVPLGDNARLRIAGDHQDRDGYLHNISGVGPSRYNDVNYTSLRASLVVDLTPDLENYMIGSFTRSNTNGSVQKLIGCNPAGYNPVNPALGGRNFIGVFSCGQLAHEKTLGAGFYDLEAALPNPISRITQWQFINTTTWHASDTLTLKNIASYAQFSDLQRSPLFGTNWSTANLPFPYAQFVFPFGAPAIFTDISPIPGLNTSDQSTFTEEFQVQGSAMDHKLTYQLGAYLEVSDPLGPSGNQSNQLAPCTDLSTFQCTDPIGQAFTAALTAQLGFPFPVHVGAVNYTSGRTSYRDVGLYAQATYKLTSQLSLTGGFRYTWDRQTNDSTRYYANFAVLPPYTAAPVFQCTDPGQAPTCSEHLQQSSQKPTWLIDLDYKPTDDILLYAKYSRGYRAGGVAVNAPIDHRTFEPEQVDSYEGGIKTTFRGAVHGTFNVSAFYNNFSNQQLQLGFNNNQNFMGSGQPAPVSPTTAIINAGKSRIWGIEAEATITPFRGFTFDGSYTYLNTSVQKVGAFSTTDPNYQANNTTIAPGAPLVLSPRNKFTVTGTYTLPLPESIGKISFGATFTHTDKQISTYDYYGTLGAPTVATFGADFGTLAPRDLLNLNLSWNGVGGLPVDLAVFATNVTDAKYYAFVPGLDSSGAEFAVLGEPRMFGGRVRYRF
jgi:iron complex outermembrane receptor protein